MRRNELIQTPTKNPEATPRDRQQWEEKVTNMKNQKQSKYSKEQSLEDRLGKFPNLISNRWEERDWVLLRALSMQRRGHTEEAKNLFRDLVKYHTEPAGPYGSGLFLYDPRDSPKAMGYGLAIAQFAGLEDEVIEDLTQKLEKAMQNEEILKGGTGRLQHVILKESDRYTTDC